MSKMKKNGGRAAMRSTAAAAVGTVPIAKSPKSHHKGPPPPLWVWSVGIARLLFFSVEGSQVLWWPVSGMPYGPLGCAQSAGSQGMTQNPLEREGCVEVAGFKLNTQELVELDRFSCCKDNIKPSLRMNVNKHETPMQELVRKAYPLYGRFAFENFPVYCAMYFNFLFETRASYVEDKLKSRYGQGASAKQRQDVESEADVLTSQTILWDIFSLEIFSKFQKIARPTDFVIAAVRDCTSKDQTLATRSKELLRCINEDGLLKFMRTNKKARILHFIRSYSTDSFEEDLQTIGKLPCRALDILGGKVSETNILRGRKCLTKENASRIGLFPGPTTQVIFGIMVLAFGLMTVATITKVLLERRRFTSRRCARNK